MKQNRKVDSTPTLAAPFNNPFSGLKSSLGELPPGPAPLPPRPPKPVKGPARAVIRLERTGRGGKEVTVVDHLGLSPDELGRWLKALKQSLGCGGTVEGQLLVLQGDQRDRLQPALIKQGVRSVTVG